VAIAVDANPTASNHPARRADLGLSYVISAAQDEQRQDDEPDGAHGDHRPSQPQQHERDVDQGQGSSP
jgi:hypothetical protein